MDLETLSRVVGNVTIFSRVTPVQKNRIMNSLKRNGLVIGYLILVELTKKWFYNKYSLFIERKRVIAD